MSYQNWKPLTKKQKGKKTINCRGDAVVGDKVIFQRAVFSGSWRNATFEGFEIIRGEIIRDSYGVKKQQHTFTLKVRGKGEMRIKGRNLYATELWREEWEDETERLKVREGKHARGSVAREIRRLRIKEREESGFNL